MLNIALCVMMFSGFYAGDIQEAQPSYSFHIQSGISYSMFMPGDYSHLTGEKPGSLDFNAAVSVTDEIPIFSEFRFSTGLSGSASLSERAARLSSADTGNRSFFLELKSPFTTNFLSHDSRWYLQFAMSGSRYQTKAADDIYYKDGSLFSAGSNLTLGESIWRVSLAIDTPYTLRDRAESRSRFGIFYQESDRGRSVDINGVNYLLGMTERTVGAFYDLKKPVFRPELVLAVSLALGFSNGQLDSNSFGYKSSDFDSMELMLYAEAGLGLSYRFRFTEHLGLKLGMDYKYSTYMPFDQSGGYEFEMDGDHRVAAGATFSYIR